jgi:hypothetical protein
MRAPWLALALLQLVVVCEIVNRRVAPSEYPRIHTYLSVASCGGLAVALLLATRGGAGARVGRPAVRVATAAAVVAAFAVALAFGLHRRADRWEVATRGNHARHLVWLARAALDLDGDGASAVLGGGDCDDTDPAVGPHMREVPGNGIDDDCDGIELIADPAATALDGPAFTDRLAGWLAAGEPARLIGRARDMNLLVISIDALRADVLIDTPESRAAFPHLHALLDGAWVFERAFSPSAGTDIAVSGFVTGRVDPFRPLPTTLIEAVRATGRRTHAVLPSEVLRYCPSTLLTRGLDGHDRVVNDPYQRDVGSLTTSVTTTDRALDAIAAAAGDGRPWFVWAHYFDVHEHAQVEPDDPALDEIARRDALASPAKKYLALAGLVDREIGRLFASVAERGAADRTIVVLFSDHGEALGEDARLPANHGRFVYNALTHVPYAIRVPGEAPVVVTAPVSLLDLLPTLLTLVGSSAPPGTDGRSLLPFVVPGAPDELRDPRRPVVLNESDQWGIIVWPHKLLVRPVDNLIELYDIETDFGEQRDLSAARPDLVAALRRAYQAYPQVPLDRTRAGRQWRERQARPPPLR